MDSGPCTFDWSKNARWDKYFGRLVSAFGSNRGIQHTSGSGDYGVNIWSFSSLSWSEDLVLYCARHDYGTRVLSNTGNLAAVMRTMGHKDVRAAMNYQHPDLEIVRAALNRTNESPFRRPHRQVYGTF